MSGDAKFRWFLLAPALLCFLSACASTGTLDNTSSTLQTNTSREVKLEGEERAKCEWEREYRKGPGEVLMECNDYSGEPRVQGYELCPPGWHDKFVAGVYSEGESRNKEQVRSGICVHNNTADSVKNMIAEGIKFDQINKAPTEPRQCKAVVEPFGASNAYGIWKMFIGPIVTGKARLGTHAICVRADRHCSCANS